MKFDSYLIENEGDKTTNRKIIILVFNMLCIG